MTVRILRLGPPAGRRTVAGELEAALPGFCGWTSADRGGRTDAGVHATGRGTPRRTRCGVGLVGCLAGAAAAGVLPPD